MEATSTAEGVWTSAACVQDSNCRSSCHTTVQKNKTGTYLAEQGEKVRSAAIIEQEFMMEVGRLHPIGSVYLKVASKSDKSGPTEMFPFSKAFKVSVAVCYMHKSQLWLRIEVSCRQRLNDVWRLVNWHFTLLTSPYRHSSFIGRQCSIHPWRWIQPKRRRNCKIMLSRLTHAC